MSEEKIMLHIMVTGTGYRLPIGPISDEAWKQCTYHDNKKMFDMNVSKDMDEFQLKDYMRARGFISSQSEAYNNSMLFFATGFDKEFVKIADSDTADGRSLAKLGATEGSLLVVMAARERTYTDWSNMRCLYGCPMAKSVQDEIVEAESYNTEDSIRTDTAI